MTRNRWRLLLILAILAILGIVFLYWREGGFMKLHGKLLLPFTYTGAVPGETEYSPLTALAQKPALAINMINFEEGAECKEYFKNERYRNLDYCYNRADDMICTAQKVPEGYYTVLQVSQNGVKEIFTSSEPIVKPILVDNDENLLFNKAGKLYKYSVKNKAFVELLRDMPNDKTGSSYAGAILVTDGDYVKICNQNGELETVVKGNSPVWFEVGKSFVYFNGYSSEMVLYNISDQKQQVIAKDIRVVGDIVLSPDKKYLAFHELVDRKALMVFRSKMLPDTFLRVMTVDGWVKKDIMVGEDTINSGSRGFDWIN